MPSLSYTLNLKARGFAKTVKRAMSMINRYGFSSKKMERNITDFVTILGIEGLIAFCVLSRSLNQIEGRKVT